MKLPRFTIPLGRVPLFVALAYACFSAVWILFSDGILATLASGYEQYQLLQTIKGWSFVAVTTGLLFLVLRSSDKRLLSAYQRATSSEQRLELALASAGGGHWDRDLKREEVYFSPKIKQLVGISPDEDLTFDQWKQRVHPDDIARVAASTRLAANSRGRRIHDVRYRVRASDDSYHWVQSRGNVICDEHGEPQRMAGIMLDVTAQVQAEARIKQLTHYDTLTGLANGATFLQELDDALAVARRCGQVIAVARITIADFNDLLDEFSVKNTDKIVQMVGEQIKRQLGAVGLAGRLSHDTFIVATAPCPSAQQAQDTIGYLVSSLDRPLAIGKRRIQPTFNAGAVVAPNDGESAHILLANSNRALSRQRSGSREIVQWYAEGMDVESRQRSQRLRDLRVAVTRKELICHYQPIIGTTEGRTIGFEALARWNRSSEGLVPPDQFIALAEESGCIHEIGVEILHQACRQAKSWDSHGGANPFVAVNVSARQLDDPEFLSVIERALTESGLKADRLELEVTENGLVNDFDAARERLASLRKLGVSIAMDDFGTGYSSLAALSRLPFNRLKIDRDFVSGYGTDRHTTAIVNATLQLCNAMGLDVTAEGVETAEQAALLTAHGVQAAQGYYFSRPLDSGNLPALIDREWSIETPQNVPAPLAQRRSA